MNEAKKSTQYFSKRMNEGGPSRYPVLSANMIDRNGPRSIFVCIIKTMSIDNLQHVSQYPSTFYRVSLKAVIRDDTGNILVNKEQNSDTWNLPGGGWDHGETEQEALARELLEEVGYEGTFQANPVKTAVFWLESKQAWLLWIVYEIKTENNNFSVGNDSSEIKFLDPSSLESATSPEERWIYNNL